ncbi:MAG TPA: GGDEF domain-containing protein [Myxococcaceae bacterium]|nr:GGDEF domain-containing protein [Myxococcaceae bacterium]HZA52155.1 GGDEF domain-containing protein [Myxococcaceae bacterium]
MSEHAPWLDTATGALRRGAFDAHTAEAVRHARRTGQALSLVWVDVDDLLEHNDLHGREELDRAIEWIVSTLGALVDGAGPIGRVRGGAFAVLLPGADRTRALEVSEGIRALVSRQDHRSAWGDYRLTVSVGVASLRGGEPWGNFLEAAEAACLRAKQGGRDGVVAR